MHAPVVQTVPMVHDVHIAPNRPQADELEPPSHTPVAEQHPLAQVVALHAGGGGVHASHIEGSASDSIARRTRFMGRSPGRKSVEPSAWFPSLKAFCARLATGGRRLSL